MSANIFSDALFWFFAIIGIFNILSDIAGFFFSLGKSNYENDQFVVLTVKNQQKTIEGLIRGIVWQHLHQKNGGHVPKIIVVDLGSTDNTPDILKKIACDYSFVQVTDKEGYIKFIKGMS